MNTEQSKTILEEKKKELEVRIKALGTPPDFNDEPGLDDDADETEEFFNQQSKAAALKTHLADVESALLKIEKGEYGACEVCGEKMSAEMLETNPETRTCKECKTAGR